MFHYLSHGEVSVGWPGVPRINYTVVDCYVGVRQFWCCCSGAVMCPSF